MTIWIAYQRVSDPRQEKEGHSIPAQKEANGKYVASRGGVIHQDYTESSSATQGDRDKFLELLSFVKKSKKPVSLVVEKTDRLHRTWEDYSIIQKLIQTGKLEVHFSRDSRVVNQDSPPESILHTMFDMVFAAYYPINLSREIKKGLRQRLLKGEWPHKPPPGYKHVDGLVVPDPETRDYIAYAFELYATGVFSLEGLRKALYDEGYFYKPHLPKLQKAQLGKVLTNPFYIGRMEWKGETYDGKHEHLVSVETWIRAQEAGRKGNKPVQYNKRVFRYGQLLKCGACGSQVVAEIKKGGKYVYYRCGNNAKRQGCEQGYINETLLDEQFNGLIQSIRMPTEFEQEIRREILEAARLNENTLADETNKIAREINRKRSQKKQAYQDRLDGLIDAETYREIADENDIQILGLEERLSKIKRVDNDFYSLADAWFELPKILAGKWSTASDEKRKKMLFFLGSNYTLLDKELSWTLKEPFASMVNSAVNEKMVELTDRGSNFLSLILSQADLIRTVRKALAA